MHQSMQLFNFWKHKRTDLRDMFEHKNGTQTHTQKSSYAPCSKAVYRTSSVTCHLCGHQRRWWPGDMGMQWQKDLGSRFQQLYIPWCSWNVFMGKFNSCPTTPSGRLRPVPWGSDLGLAGTRASSGCCKATKGGGGFLKGLSNCWKGLHSR